MEKFFERFKFKVNKKVEDTEEKALSKRGDYSTLADTIQTVDLKIEKVEEKMEQKDKEIRDVEERIIKIFLKKDEVNDFSSDDPLHKQLTLQEESLETEYKSLNEERENLENEKFLLIEGN